MSSQSPPPLPLMIVAGVFLFGISVAIPFLVRDSVARFAPFSLALIGAFVTVFFKGYRGIFFGFFIALGVSILAAVAVCFGLLSGPQSFK
jgi:hypothetical protein